MAIAPDMKDLVFIASGGRTGTNLFGDRLMDVIEDCWSQHEPDNFVLRRGHPTHQRIAEFGFWHMTLGKVRTGLRAIGTRYQNGAGKSETLAALRRLRGDYHSRHSESLIVESYYAWWLCADIFDEAFPGARMVGVIRDPKDWIESWLAHNPKRRRGFEPMARSVRCPGWNRMSQVERLAWEWNKIATTLSRNEGSNVKVFRFEDLMFAKDLSALEAMVRFIANGRKIGEIDQLRKRRVNSSKRQENREHISVRDAEITQALKKFAQPMIHRFGYTL